MALEGDPTDRKRHEKEERARRSQQIVLVYRRIYSGLGYVSGAFASGMSVPVIDTAIINPSAGKAAFYIILEAVLALQSIYCFRVSRRLKMHEEMDEDLRKIDEQ